MTPPAALAGDVSKLADVGPYINKVVCSGETAPYYIWRGQFTGYYIVTPGVTLKSKLMTPVEIDIFLDGVNKVPGMDVTGDLIEVFKDPTTTNFYVAVANKGCIVANGPMSPESFLTFTGKLPSKAKFNPSKIEINTGRCA